MAKRGGRGRVKVGLAPLTNGILCRCVPTDGGFIACLCRKLCIFYQWLLTLPYFAAGMAMPAKEQSAEESGKRGGGGKTAKCAGEDESLRAQSTH